MEYFNEAKKKTICQGLHALKLTNLNNTYPKWKVERLCKKWRMGSDEFRDRRYSTDTINKLPNSYNAICRRQLLHKLDQLIVERMMALRKIHALKSANPKDWRKEIEGQIPVVNSLDQSNKQSVDMKLSSTGISSYPLPNCFLIKIVLLPDNFNLRNNRKGKTHLVVKSLQIIHSLTKTSLTFRYELLTNKRIEREQQEMA